MDTQTSSANYCRFSAPSGLRWRVFSDRGLGRRYSSSLERGKLEAVVQFFENPLHMTREFRDILLHHLPGKLDVHAKILVDQYVAGAGDFAPGNFRI